MLKVSTVVVSYNVYKKKLQSSYIVAIVAAK